MEKTKSSFEELLEVVVAYLFIFGFVLTVSLVWFSLLCIRFGSDKALGLFATDWSFVTQRSSFFVFVVVVCLALLIFGDLIAVYIPRAGAAFILIGLCQGFIYGLNYTASFGGGLGAFFGLSYAIAFFVYCFFVHCFASGDVAFAAPIISIFLLMGLCVGLVFGVSSYSPFVTGIGVTGGLFAGIGVGLTCFIVSVGSVILFFFLADQVRWKEKSD